MRLRLLAPAWLAFVLAACAQEPLALSPVVLETFPHDPEAFTQGLLLFDGRLFESTGLEGRSSLREVDPETGEVVRLRPLDEELFGEGLARVGDTLVQLTWTSGRAFVYDLETFELLDTHRYEGEGWGLCFDGSLLWMSDGSSELTARDPETFEVLRTVSVTLAGEPVSRLNELECVQERIYANVWLTDLIVRIDPERGRVDAVIDASTLLSAEERAALPPGAVLNGIAFDATEERFLLTGKLWPQLYAVRFE